MILSLRLLTIQLHEFVMEENLVSFSNLIATEIIDLNLCDLILFLYLRSITISFTGKTVSTIPS